MSTMLDILTTSIPSGGWGRALTSTERRRLRELVPHPVSERTIVVRRGDQPTVGTLYEPISGGEACYSLVGCAAVGMVKPS